MGFLDSSSSIVTAILTRKGRELLAKNDGSFRIVKFAFGDDEINYQLYNAATQDDTNILNLPVLEPSSNELTALRYRLVSSPQGTIQVAYLTVAPSYLTLQNLTVRNPRLPNIGTITVQTTNGQDTAYIAACRAPLVAFVQNPIATAEIDPNLGVSSALITIQGGQQDGSTYIDIFGRDSGAVISIPIVCTSNVVAEQ